MLKMFFELLNWGCKKFVILAKKGRDGDEKTSRYSSKNYSRKSKSSHEEM